MALLSPLWFIHIPQMIQSIQNFQLKFSHQMLIPLSTTKMSLVPSSVQMPGSLPKISPGQGQHPVHWSHLVTIWQNHLQCSTLFQVYRKLGECWYLSQYHLHGKENQPWGRPCIAPSETATSLKSFSLRPNRGNHVPEMPKTFWHVVKQIWKKQRHRQAPTMQLLHAQFPYWAAQQFLSYHPRQVAVVQCPSVVWQWDPQLECCHGVGDSNIKVPQGTVCTVRVAAHLSDLVHTELAARTRYGKVWHPHLSIHIE